MMRLRSWTRRKGAVAAFGAVLALDLGLGVQSTALAIAASAAETDVSRVAASASDSAITVPWLTDDRDTTDPDFASFEKLEVTVSQTEGLTNQGIAVSWEGARQTSLGEYATDYLQIMQCWGGADGPEPTQCQWGQQASNLATLMGTNTGGRGLVKGEDPDQEYGGKFLVPPPRTNPNLKAYGVPFVSVKGVSTFDSDTFFSTSSTNEVSAARTGADGSGLVVFETQTSLEAPHLGCGAPVATDTGTAPRDCWLVVVPRGSHNADGSPAAVDASKRISGSPLSAGNWQERIQVPLHFASITTTCAIGADEQRTVGNEPVAEAFTSWQAALCGTGTTYGFSQIGDAEARRQVVSTIRGASRLGFVSSPLDSTLAADETLLYAPVSTSAVVVAFTIERNLTGASPEFDRNGTLVTDLTLTPRLVAKLLTQSYRADVPNGNAREYLASNPRSLLTDPEFLRLNPLFTDFAQGSEPDGLKVPLGGSDAANAVWRWLQSDPDAREFLSGQPDEWGARINPAYSALGLATDPAYDSFPKADMSTYRQRESIPEPGFGTLDLRPYMGDMHEAAYRTRRADANVKVVWDDTRVPPAFISSGAQLPGQRFSLAITDSASAERYSLQTAKLVNAAGRAVAPTAEGMTTGVDAMVASDVPGVRVVDPDARVSRAYPLTVMTYAVVNVCEADAGARSDYAALLRYAATDGQLAGDTRGLLPRGYQPLSQTDAAQTADVASDLASGEAAASCPVETPDPTPTPTDSSTPTSSPSSTPAPEASGTPTPEPTATATPKPEPTSTIPPVVPAVPTDDEPIPEQTAVVITPNEPTISATPAVATGASRYAFLAALFFALPCLLGGPLLLRRAR
jgi:hypothetical protein